MSRLYWILAQAALVLLAAVVGLRGCQQVRDDQLKPVRQSAEFKQLQHDLKDKP